MKEWIKKGVAIIIMGWLAIVFFNMKHLNKHYEGVLLNKDYEIIKNINVAIKGEKEVLGYIEGEITIDGKTYYMNLAKEKEKKNELWKYSGLILDFDADNLKVGKVYLSSNYKTVYLKLFQEDTFVACPNSEVQNLRSVMEIEGTKK